MPALPAKTPSELTSSTGADSQVGAVRNILPQAPAVAANQARVIMPSPLQLSLAQEQRLLSHLKRERNNLEAVLGRMDYSSAQWVNQSITQRVQTGQDTMPFCAQRHLAHLIAEGHMEWRTTMFGAESIWNYTNYHLPLTARVLQQQIARACDHFFGTAPWMTCNPVGKSDGDRKKAEHYTAWSRSEAESAGLESTLKDALALAFIQGEQVVQTDYLRKVAVYPTVQEVAIDPTTKQPFVAQDGDYITRRDIFEPVMPPADPMVQPEAVQPIGHVLKRDGKTPLPTWWNADDPQQFVWHKYTKIRTIEEGARAFNIHHLDFLVTPTAANIQDAPLCVHYETIPIINFISGMLTDQWDAAKLAKDDRQKIISRIIHEISGSTHRTDQTAAVSGARPELQESNLVQQTTSAEPQMTLVKHWVHYQPYDDGIVMSLLVITDESGTIPLYYDAVANLTDDGLRPYTVIRVNPVANRWHGIGQPQKFFQLQHFADLLLNRINFSQMQSSNVIFWRPHLTKEGATDPDLKLNTGKTYTLIGDFPVETVLKVVPIHDIKSNDLRTLLELIVQMFINMSGVSNVNDSRMAGLDSTELATGVKNLDAAGKELFSKILGDLQEPLTKIAKRFLALTVKHIQGRRAYLYFEGDVVQNAHMTPEDVADLELDVRLELSRYSGQQELQQIQSQMAVVERYVNAGATDPTGQMQSIMYPFVIALLKVLGVKNPEDRIPKPVINLAAGPPPAPPSQGAPSSTPPPAPTL